MLKVTALQHTCTNGYGGHAAEAIGDLTFEVGEQELACVLGPSGCGKTTLLRCMAGLLAPTRGGVYLHGQRIEQPPERMALVFQEHTASFSRG